MLFASLVFRVVCLFTSPRETLNKPPTRKYQRRERRHAEGLTRKKRSASRVSSLPAPEGRFARETSASYSQKFHTDDVICPELRHQYGISGCKSQTSLSRNALRGPGAMRGGCIRRLTLTQHSTDVIGWGSRRMLQNGSPAICAKYTLEN